MVVESKEIASELGGRTHGSVTLKVASACEMLLVHASSDGFTFVCCCVATAASVATKRNKTNRIILCSIESGKSATNAAILLLPETKDTLAVAVDGGYI